MMLVRRNPFWALSQAMFNDMLDDTNSSSSNSSNLATNLYETDKAYVMELSVPGFKKEDISMHLEGRQLTIKGNHEVTNEHEDDKRHYYLKSFSKSSFGKVVTLPEKVAQDAIEAKVLDGVLHVTMPKAAQAIAKSISIN
ncbi:MAG: Hsp20/alpha crystallin family protein [Deinococcales bacterium]